MDIETRQFGLIRVEEENIINMPSGMPGFPENKRFAVLENEQTKPFFWYQSLDDPSIALVIMNPFLFKPDYSIDLKPAVKDMSWKENKPEDYMVYVVVNASDGSPEEITANLMGPLVINTKSREAVQMVIPNSPYSHKHPIFRKVEDSKQERENRTPPASSSR